jgi:hypothetical protein
VSVVVKKAAAKIAWVGRTASMVFGLALVMALVLGVATMAFGANGSNFILGSLNNTATAITKLTGTVGGGPALQVSNPSTATGSTALHLQVATGKAPMKVNRTTKVANLNTDRLDGKDSTELAPILRSQQDGFHRGQVVTGTTEVNSVAIQAPVNGVLMISGTAFVNSGEPAAINYILNPKVDGSNATPTGWGAYYRADVGDPTNGNGGPGSRFTLTYTVSQPVNAGSHTVTQELGQYEGAPVDFFYNNNELSVEFVPGTQASVSDAATLGAAQDSGLSPAGEPK